MRNLYGILLVICFLITFAGPGFSHGPGSTHHSHEINISTALEIAKKTVENLVSKGKLDKSWKEVDAEKAEKKTFKNGQEWVVIFTNQNEADKSKRTLYVFLTLKGKYIAANFTGN